MKFVKQFENKNTVARQTIPAPAQLLAELFREENGKNTVKFYPDEEGSCIRFGEVRRVSCPFVGSLRSNCDRQ